MNDEQKEPRPEKRAIAGEIQEQLKDSVFVILADYKGLSVSKSTELRDRLHPTGAEVHVVKNRMFQRAARDSELEELAGKIDGPTAMIVGKGDVVASAKALRAFVKENELPVVRVGALEGALLSAQDIEDLASLPSRPELLAKLVGTLAAPMTGLVGVMQQKVSSLVYVLKALEEKKQQA